ncbi:hypothetical protein LJC36_00135 [Desulfovibrio sp. OttesenSCG-928-C14]|nr:hypothetical protein [Desulfovibrio sp. OttesenSCG-928-C14]
MEIYSVVMAFAAVLTAVFTGYTAWMGKKKMQLVITPLQDGAFLVTNPSAHPVLIRKLVASKGTLALGEYRREELCHVFVDSGKTECEVDAIVSPYDRIRIEEGIMVDGNRHMVKARCRYIGRTHVHIVLSPGDPVTKNTE